MCPTHGLRQGLGFLVSSMRPDMFLRKRLCMCFSSMSRSFVSRPTSTCSKHDGDNTDKYNGGYLWIGPAVLAAGSWSWCCVVLDGDGMVCRRLLGPGQCSHAGVRHLAVRRRLLPPLLRSSVVAFMWGQGGLGSSSIYPEINVC